MELSQVMVYLPSRRDPSGTPARFQEFDDALLVLVSMRCGISPTVLGSQNGMYLYVYIYIYVYTYVDMCTYIYIYITAKHSDSRKMVMELTTMVVEPRTHGELTVIRDSTKTEFMSLTIFFVEWGEDDDKACGFMMF